MKCMNMVTSLVSASVFLLGLVGAGMASPIWVDRYDGPAHLSDYACAIAVDLDGNVYVTGFSYNGSNDDIVTIKYAPWGERLWLARYDSGGNDQGWCIALDGSGNVYVSGDTMIDPNDLTSMDIITIKYDSNGTQLWTRTHDSRDNNDHCSAISVDAIGNVYVAGSSTIRDIIPEDVDYVTIKYDAEGNKNWVRYYDGVNHLFDGIYDIALDTLGNVYVIGASVVDSFNGNSVTIKYSPNGAELWLAAEPTNPAYYPEPFGAIAIDKWNNIYFACDSWSETSSDYITIKYNPDGIRLWQASYDNINDRDRAYDIAVDESGNVYTTGSSCSTYLNYDYATVKYDSNGNEVWVRRYDGPVSGYDRPCAIDLDRAGNVYVTGTSQDDYTTIKYDQDGTVQWFERYDSPDHLYDRPSAMAVDWDGNVYVTGFSIGSTTSYDFLTVKYKASDLVAHWAFEEGTGIIVHDSAGDNHGGVGFTTPMHEWHWADGPEGWGGALNLDGSDFVETGKTASDLSINGNSARTVCAWVYTRKFDSGGVFEVGTQAPGEEFSLVTTIWDDQWRMQIWGGHPDYDADFIYSSKDKWVHLALVYDGSHAKIYADANSQPLVNVARTLNTGDGKTFKIGQWGPYYFDGKIDDVRIYNRALSPDEIAEIYHKYDKQSVCLEYPEMDFDKNCRVDFADFAHFAKSWLQCNLDPPSACIE